MPEVLDISSDDEQGSEEGPRSTTDYDWIKELLGSSDGEESNDSDDVVIIGETKPESKSKSSKLAVKDIDDDDCVVLDGDPEKDVTPVDEKEATESDELLVVGEKGPIACRDYPHARHLCAKFPFSSTPHERHCDQCHCYVCDSLAPCLEWGTGILSSDHCHANDKIEKWKIQRTNFKAGKSSQLAVSTNYGTSLNALHLQCNEILPLDVTSMPSNSLLQNQASRSTTMHTFSSLNSMPQNQASRPTTVFAVSPSLNSGLQNQVSWPNNTPVCSTATNLTIPDGANHGKCEESQSTLVRNRFRLHSVPRQVLGVRSHAIQRERGSGATSLGPQFLHSHVMSNGIGSAGDTLTLNHSAHVSSGFSSHVNPTKQYDKYHTATELSNDRNHNELNGVWLPKNLPLYPHPSSEPASLSCINQHIVASETQAYSQSLSQSNDDHDFYQSCIQDNDASSSYVACLNSNQHGIEQQIGNENEIASGNSTQCGIASQETYQPKSQVGSPSETARNAGFTAYDSSWTESTSQSIEPVIECSHIQRSRSINQPANVKEATALTTATESTEPPAQSHIPSSLIDFENWLLDKDSVLTATDGALPSELNIPSPDLVPSEAGTLLSEWWLKS